MEVVCFGQAGGSANLIAPFEDLIAQDRVLLKAASLALRGGRSLDVPVAKAGLADPRILALQNPVCYNPNLIFGRSLSW